MARQQLSLRALCWLCAAVSAVLLLGGPVAVQAGKATDGLPREGDVVVLSGVLWVVVTHTHTHSAESLSVGFMRAQLSTAYRQGRACCNHHPRAKHTHTPAPTRR